MGALFSVVFLAKTMTWLLLYQPLEIYSVFTGLILASLPKLIGLTDKKRSSFTIIICTAIGFFILFHFMLDFSNSLNSNSLFSFFLSGFLSVFASVLPGLSGSAILIILGTYHLILNAITELIVNRLIIFLMGGALGLVSALYCIRLFLKTRKNLFFCVVIGFIIGSFIEILPLDHWSSVDFLSVMVRTIIFFSIGVILYFLIERGKL